MRLRKTHWSAPDLHDLSGLWRTMDVDGDTWLQDRVRGWLRQRTKKRPWRRDGRVEVFLTWCPHYVERKLSRIRFWG